MEQRTKALKTSSKVMAILMKIGTIAMIVAMCICVISLLFMAITGGKTSIVTTNGTTIGITDVTMMATVLRDATNPIVELVAMFLEYFVMSALLFVIFLLAQRMFGEISVTGDPFKEKYVTSIRAIGILVAAISFAVGITEAFVSTITATKVMGSYAEAPGLVIGAIIFCLSYIISYGCGLKEQQPSA